MPMNIMDNQVYLNEMGPQSRLKRQPGNLNAWGTPKMDPAQQQQRAQDAVQLEFGQAQRGNEEAQRQAIAQYNRLVDEERTYGREVDPRLENIYSALQTSLGQNQTANQETYGDAIGQIRSWYDQSYQANDLLNQDAMSRITADAERLGTQAGIPDGTKRMTEDFLYNQGQNRNAQAGRSANMAELAAKIEALDRNRVGAAGREGGQQRAMLANEIAQTIGDLGLANYNELSSLRTEQAGRMADRGAAERDALQEFQQRDFDNLQTARGNSLQEFLARAGLGLQQSEFRQGNYEANRNFGLARDELGLSRDDLNLRRELGQGELELGNKQLSAEQQQRQADDAVKWAELKFRQNELATNQTRWEREFAEATSPEAKARAKAELTRIKAETDALLREGTGVGGVYEPGQIGMNKYLNDLSTRNRLQSRQKAQLQFEANDLIQEGIKGSGSFGGDQYSAALSVLNDRSRILGGLQSDANLLRELLAVYFMGTGGQ